MASEALDVVVDATGVTYVTGWTDSPYLQVTADAFDSDWQGRSGFGPARTAFVAKFASDGGLLYASYLGGERLICSGGSNCIPVVPLTEGRRIALAQGGGFVIGGVTNSTDFPVTSGAFQTECRCNRLVGDLFVARFSPDGGLDYATYLGGNPYGNDPYPLGGESLTDLAVDSGGAVYVAGWTGAADFPTTAKVPSLSVPTPTHWP